MCVRERESEREREREREKDIASVCERERESARAHALEGAREETQRRTPHPLICSRMRFPVPPFDLESKSKPHTSPASEEGLRGGVECLDGALGDLKWDVIAASVYVEYSVGPSVRSICSRCCFTMTGMI